MNSEIAQLLTDVLDLLGRIEALILSQQPLAILQKLDDMGLNEMIAELDAGLDLEDEGE